MEVDCAGCAGCCLDWRPLASEHEALDTERRGSRKPLDDAYNLVALTRDEVRRFVEEGLGDALTPRLWTVRSETGAADAGTVTVDGYELAAVAGRPAFFVGLRKPPKPVSPFDRGERNWLSTCVFLDPETLRCRVHGSDSFPRECREYPGHNLSLGQETECERVETRFGGDRLLDDEPDPDLGSPLFGPQAVGAKVFAHPRPDELSGLGVVSRLANGRVTPEDRAAFVAAAAASSPGTLASSDDHYEAAKRQVLDADSWVGRACREWRDAAGSEGSVVERSADDARSLAERIEVDRGAPRTTE